MSDNTNHAAVQNRLSMTRSIHEAVAQLHCRTDVCVVGECDCCGAAPAHTDSSDGTDDRNAFTASGRSKVLV